MPNSNIKIVERGKMEKPCTQIHDNSLSWFGTFASIKSGETREFFQPLAYVIMFLSCQVISGIDY